MNWQIGAITKSAIFQFMKNANENNGEYYSNKSFKLV